jgi:hypothetical protein
MMVTLRRQTRQRDAGSDRIVEAAESVRNHPRHYAWLLPEWHNLPFCPESCASPFLLCPFICQIRAFGPFLFGAFSLMNRHRPKPIPPEREK